MLQIFAIAFGISLVVILVTSAAALTYTAICIIAGAGIGCVATIFFVWDEWQKQQVREEQRRAREHQRLLELVKASRAMGAQVDVPTLEVRRSLPRAICKS